VFSDFGRDEARGICDEARRVRIPCPILNVAIRGDDRRQFGESESLDGAGYDNVNAVIGSGRSLT
jgi:hypothetical protein